MKHDHQNGISGVFLCIFGPIHLHTKEKCAGITAAFLEEVFLVKKWVTNTIAFVIAVSVVFSVLPEEGHSLGERLLKIGSRGSEVSEVQGRLSYLGFYTGAIDGQYGWRTYRAVRLFQYEFGLDLIDGIVGPKTGSMLVRATREWYPGITGGPGTTLGSGNRFSQSDMTLMARAVYGEARGEPYKGQVAVAAVILNRIESELFPNTVSGVIYQPGAFTAVADGQIWLQPDDTAMQAVKDAISGWDPTGNALYYFNPATATSKWIWTRPQIIQIGKHIFCY